MTHNLHVDTEKLCIDKIADPEKDLIFEANQNLWSFRLPDPDVPKRTNEFSYTDSETVVRVYHLGRALSQVFLKHGLYYWTSSGTTLGAVRHCGMIPWDDDMDLCILEEQLDLLMGSVAMDLDVNHDIIVARREVGNGDYAYNIFHRTKSSSVWTIGGKACLRYPLCDIFVMKRASNQPDKLIPVTEVYQKAYPEETYHVEDVMENAKMLKFGDFELRCNIFCKHLKIHLISFFNYISEVFDHARR
ncbi:uncharacterized protein RP688-like isoform X2 [Symsagittifera roscoffensis]|uniref:uncharacterized protein RP688-like isoform X2 n=1 Tax=Symsagittifera roscoffensis TaxID=84072 RepID=UPI00307B77F7